MNARVRGRQRMIVGSASRGRRPRQCQGWLPSVVHTRIVAQAGKADGPFREPALGSQIEPGAE